MKTFKNMHVLLLKGGNGSERDVSLNTAEVCSNAIKQIGHKITEIDIAEIDILIHFSCFSRCFETFCCKKD